MDKLIVALDVDTLEAAGQIVNRLYPAVKIFKVGSQLFTNCGPQAVELVHGKGAKVFLDLKFHDIPNTVSNAARAAAKLGVFMFNVHVQGGFDMMRKAVAIGDVSQGASSLDKGVSSLTENWHLGKRPLVLGVTVLTSMGEKDLRDLEIRKGLKSQVTYLAKLAKDAGLDGVVASAEEIQPIRWACGDEFIIVAPGIRPAWAQKQDQKRTATPKEAISLGANYIVVGRPILEAEDPKAAAEEIIKEIT
ncbi:MAG: orotidine-5'-phosphate decarboxylase [Candidatus Omnitrophica bacterium]|nr:orotidine-5'-phosphate decarboxylase [Candidatus Omnitrophota bacterium]